MTVRSDQPLVPRDGRTLNVLAICRISTVHQKDTSLEAQEALLRRSVADLYGGPTRWEVIATRGSGERLDREELARAEDLIKSRQLDLVIAEDLGRLCRRIHAYSICELAQDCGTRVIFLNDHVDTGRGDWQLGALFSAYRHESYCRDTSNRVRRSHRDHFTARGGLVHHTIYGYILPPGAKTDAELRQDEAAIPVYDEWFRRLEDGASYAEVADWLNRQGIPPGPLCRSSRWDRTAVRGVTHNPILKGLRVRNRKMVVRVNETGRGRSVDAPPEERLERLVPHLAFIEPVRYDRVIALLARRNAKYRRKGGAVDPRKDVPRKRTVFPGQHLSCGVCGRLYYYGGHGKPSHMMCSGGQKHRCWNGVSVEGALAASRIGAAVLAEVATLPGFDEAFVRMVREEAEALHAEDDRRIAECRRREALVAQQLGNITGALAEQGSSRALQEKLRSLEAEADRLAAERRDLEHIPRAEVELPSMDRIRELAREAFEGLARGSQEARRLALRLLPRFEVRPNRLCDGGEVVLRAHLTLDLAPLVPDARALEGRIELLRRELVVDLFEPPKRAAYRERVMALRAEGLTQREAAERLGLGLTDAQRAARLDREMKRLGLADPYVELEGPPPDQRRMRRHKHSRYRFEPKADDTPRESA